MIGSSCRRLVVVAPRPADEVRAAGLLAPLDGAAPEIDLLALTSPAPPAAVDDADETPDETPDPQDAPVLEAYALAGVPEVRRHRLGLPAGGVAAREADVVAALSEILGWAHPVGLGVLAPPAGGTDDPDPDPDPDPDADAAGRAAELVCAAYRVRLVTWEVPGRESGAATAR